MSLPPLPAGVDYSANVSFLWTEFFDPIDRLSCAAAARFNAVEMLLLDEVDLRRLQRGLRSHEADLVLFDPYPGRWAAGERGLLCLPDRDRELRSSVFDALDTAELLGTRMLNILLGCPPVSLPHHSAIALATDRLAELGGLAYDRGVQLLIEALNPSDYPGYLVSDVGEAARVVSDIDHELVGLLFDSYHVAVCGTDPATAFAEVADVVAHIQIADAPGRHQPGTGTTDFGRLFADLRCRAWTGRVGLEYRPTGSTFESFNWPTLGSEDLRVVDGAVASVAAEAAQSD